MKTCSRCGEVLPRDYIPDGIDNWHIDCFYMTQGERNVEKEESKTTQDQPSPSPPSKPQWWRRAWKYINGD